MDSSKLFELPKQLGPGLVQKVLKDTIQHLVNTAHDIQSVTTLMKKQGDSTCTITGKINTFVVFNMYSITCTNYNLYPVLLYLLLCFKRSLCKILTKIPNNSVNLFLTT